MIAVADSWSPSQVNCAPCSRCMDVTVALTNQYVGLDLGRGVAAVGVEHEDSGRCGQTPAAGRPARPIGGSASDAEARHRDHEGEQAQDGAR